MLESTWHIMLELSPWLILGAVVAAALHVFIPRNFIQRQLSGKSGILKAVLLGVPLPLCSCGVIPTGLGLQKDGASRGATVGFLISTPQTGVDSILVSASFLGWPFAIFKLVSAAATGLVGGFLTDMALPETENTADNSSDASAGRPSLSEGFEHGIDILQSIWKWLVVGVLAAAALEVYLPATWANEIAQVSPWLAMLAVLAISTPLYVCATASVPIAAALVANGFPPGAALVFLMAGPATNIATLGAVYRGIGGRALGVYLGTILVGSMGLGMLFDSVIAHSTDAVMPHEHGEAWWVIASAVMLSILLLKFLIDDLRVWLGSQSVSESKPTVAIAVEGMTCGGCVAKLQKRLLATDGIHSATVSLEPGQACIESDLDTSAVEAIIREAGFRVPLPES